MSRAASALVAIKNELQSDPAGMGYAGLRDAASKAIALSKPISKTPQEIVSRPANVIEILSTKSLTAAQITLLNNFVVANGILTASELRDVNTEIFTSRADILKLGHITQGEVEQALK
jgi:hypothetical protein